MMSVLVAGPDAEPVSVEELRGHLHVTSGGEGDLLGSLISSARLVVEAETGVRMMTQRWKILLDEWPGRVIPLPLWPVSGLTNVGLPEIPGGGLDPSSYVLEGLTRPACVIMAEGVVLPRPTRLKFGIQIEIDTGFGSDPDDVPENLRTAVLLLAAHWYDADDWSRFRRDRAVPSHIGAMLQPHRVVRV